VILSSIVLGVILTNQSRSFLIVGISSTLFTLAAHKLQIFQFNPTMLFWYGLVHGTERSQNHATVTIKN